jgi:hypothetical protein
VTGRALGLGVAGRAELPRARGAHAVLAHAVLAHEVALMNDVARGRDLLAREIHVAAVAVARLPLVLVLMAREALGHLGPHRGLIDLAGRAVTLHALAANRREVLLVREPEVLAREGRLEREDVADRPRRVRHAEPRHGLGIDAGLQPIPDP